MFSLKSKITQKVLTLFFFNDKQKFYVNEIAKRIKEDPSNVHKKLKELNKEDILSDEMKGRERYFFLNKSNPLLNEYRKIILNDIGLERRLKKEIGGIKGVKSIYIFGTYGRNIPPKKGNINVLVVGEFDSVKIQEKLMKIQDFIGRDIGLGELTEREFANRKKERDPLLKDLFANRYVKVV